MVQEKTGWICDKMDKITVFKNQVTQYGVMHYFRESLTKAFQKKGIEIELIDIAHLTKPDLFKLIYRSPPDYTLAFNGLQALPEGNFLSDELEIPHAAWLVDSAHYFTGMAKGAYNLIISPDQLSADLHQAWGSSHSYFLPHAFEASLKTAPEQERPFPIVFLGTFIDPTEIQEAWKEIFPKNHLDSLIQIAEKVIKTPSLTYQKALADYIAEDTLFWSRFPPKDINLLNISFDQYIRARDRIELLKSLEGLPVHIFGKVPGKRNWGDFLKEGQYTFHPSVDFPESIEIMKQAQIVLNSSPMFKTGAHERIFYGLGSGAAVLTNHTPWIDAHYVKNEEILVFDHETTKESIKELLSQPEKLVQIAKKGQEKVMRQDTWDARAGSLLNIMEEKLESFS